MKLSSMVRDCLNNIGTKYSKDGFDVFILEPQAFGPVTTLLEYNYEEHRRTLLLSTDLDELIPLFQGIRSLDPTVFTAIKQCHDMGESGLYRFIILGFDNADARPYVRGTLKKVP